MSRRACKPIFHHNLPGPTPRVGLASGARHRRGSTVAEWIDRRIIVHQYRRQYASSLKTIGRSIWQNWWNYDTVNFSERKANYRQEESYGCASSRSKRSRGTNRIEQPVCTGRSLEGNGCDPKGIRRLLSKTFTCQHVLIAQHRAISGKRSPRLFKFCNHLRDVPSDTKGMNGHDRVITAVRDDLASAHPLPIFFTWHPGVRLEVSKGRALSFSKTEYLIISAPVGHAAS